MKAAVPKFKITIIIGTFYMRSHPAIKQCSIDLTEIVRGCGPDSSDSGQEQVASSCDYGYEQWGLQKGWEFLSQLTDHQLLVIK